MRAARQRTAQRAVVALFLIGLVVAYAGNRHRNARLDAQVTWQDVSATLQDVETAKRDLFQSMQEKTGSL